MPPTIVTVFTKQQSKNSKKCLLMKKNLEKCIQIRKGEEENKCRFYKKVLYMCMKRKTNIFMSGP